MCCHCGSSQEANNCCQSFISGNKVPKTAEALMRSRYTAYVLSHVDYLIQTWASNKRAKLDRDALVASCQETEWLGLRILETVDGKETDNTGIVEFEARFKDATGTEQALRERSSFIKEDGRWVYVSGTHKENTAATKAGRNDPCPCGSGKKFKKCCGG